MILSFPRILALFLASIGNPPANTINGRSTNGVCRPTLPVATNIFQSTAMPVKIYNSFLYATTAKQGAGLINAYQGLTTNSMFSPSQLALNDSVRTFRSYTVKLWNIGDKCASYKLSHSGAALATGLKPGDDMLLNLPLYSPDYATVTIEPTKFRLNPGQSQNIILKFQAPCNANRALLPIYSGFIYATNIDTGEKVHLSYAGMVGNYGEARMLVRNAFSGIVTGLQYPNGQYLSYDQLPTIEATQGANVIIVLAWATRLLFAEVVSSDANIRYGLAYSQANASVIFGINVPRNAAPFGLHGVLYQYRFPWDSYFCPIQFGPTCTNNNSVALPSGQYRIRFSALKPFRITYNPDDFDVYTTPPFYLNAS